MQKINVYRKHNSFIELRKNADDDQSGVLARISKIRRLGASMQPNFSYEHRNILQLAFADLLDNTSDQHRFMLSPNVVEEIDTLDDIDVSRYLVHRYRYEMYPQTRMLDEFPPYLQIEPSSICNYRCVFCFETDKFFTRKSNGFMGHMTLDTFKSIVDQVEGNVEFISLASRGEPLLCPDIEGMLAYTRDKFLNLKMNTNASMLDEAKAHAILQSGIKTLVFSADAAEEPLYSQLRVNGNLENVLKNIERFQKIRQNQYPNSRIITRVSGVKFDDRQNLDAMQKLWGGLVDQVAFVDYNPWENAYERAPIDIDTPCSDLWRRMFVWWDGKVNPCDVDYRSTLSVGTISDSSISSLWRSPGYARLREFHENLSRGNISPCKSCSVV